ncbi:Agmatine deiminase [Listeria monocytogenes]|uniref:agmatine deiminase n=1 Tax=Listeria monocytogenes TaxID=1639 RepID=UPI000E73C683|nr:agmatine deiminase [Listeria monocytogenes]EAE9405975.1 agmatine deiminase [Listeria monocytogenes]EAF0634349.1 agmatine deiminase [Listeria monocytogenes]EHN1770430.1 agmatine deiminase [Listeria monocytogenes]RKC32905.1 Agmatine deiminase [Listeria monocytogenes]HDT8344982.1 agmatine deiminase [Listeria monocytogenes]
MGQLKGLPVEDGFRMPGEYEPHIGCFMIWPERPDNWRLGGKPAQQNYKEVAVAISNFEPVTMFVSPNQYKNARKELPDTIRVIEMSNDDAWIRDYGPSFLVNDKGEMRGVDWGFNAWGGLLDGLYFPWDKDNQIAKKVCDLERLDYYSQKDFILEGCSIHVDGEGTLVTTEECLLSEGRNPNLTKIEIEQTLKKNFHVQKVIWLKHGFYLDETNGHVDNIFNFVAPGEVVLSWTDNKSDPQYEISRECYDILANQTDAKGRTFIIHKLHCPDPVLITQTESEGVEAINGTFPRQAGDRLAASYVNYYTANGAIIFPLFDDPKDKDAQELLEQLYPDRKIVGIKAREILLGGGNIHCITQHLPDKSTIRE